MGYMKDATGRRLDDFEVADAGATQTAALIQRLRAGNEDATLAVLGDSTGNETFEWPYLLTQWLAAQFPAYTVLHRLWNHANQNYDSATTVQTGTGARTLTVYNGSTPGQITDYSVTRLASQVPVTPQLVMVNYGYNEGTGVTTAYRYKLYDLTRRIEDRFPGAGIIVTAQPPVGALAAIVNADHMARGRIITELAGTEGYGLVNALQIYLDNPTWEADWINSSDHLHPNSAGQLAWFEQVKRQFPVASRTLRPKASVPSAHRLWIPPSAFIASEGSPTLAIAGVSGNAPFPAWEFDQATQQGIVATIDYPDSWQYVNIYVNWAYASSSGFTGSNNGVWWEVSYSRPSVTGPWPGPATTATNGAQNAFSTAGVLSSASNSGPWLNVNARCVTNTAIASRPLVLRVRRLPGNANDTMAESAFLRGVMIERAG